MTVFSRLAELELVAGLRKKGVDAIPFDIVDALLDVGRNEWSDAAFVEVIDLLVRVLT